ncbi:MAG: right-handed parallel beta-helix repeat-containing protein, partial [Phycisphaerae bacterium]|nr:right-handed parallel beta-helix repeat-containing protein [Phycisphaerae bacterium]
MMRHMVIICGLVLCLSLACYGRTITVALDGSGEFSTIQGAIDAANNGDSIVVGDGVYTGDGNRDIDFKGKAITVSGQNGPEFCIIDCQGSAAEPHRGFILQTQETQTSVIDGFTIKNGYAPRGFRGYDYAYGGAILCDCTGPVIRNCRIVENRADTSGGGILLYEHAPFWSRNTTLIEDCEIRSNSSWYGGGIMVRDVAHAVITGCVISDNRSEGAG